MTQTAEFTQTNISFVDNGYVVLEKYIGQKTRKDIFDLLCIAKPPEEFNYEADIKYLYYKQDNLVGIIAYDLSESDGNKVPLFIHVIGHPDFTHTRQGYNFLFDTFRDLKRNYNIIVAHTPNDRVGIIRLMLKVGFVMYSEAKDSKYYYLDLGKIK